MHLDIGHVGYSSMMTFSTTYLDIGYLITK